MAITATDVRAIAPEFASPGTSDATIDAYISDAAVLFSTSNLTDPDKSFVLKWGTAHLLSLSGRGAGGTSTGGTRGPITAERVGQVGRSFASTAGAGTKLSELSSTRYGAVLASYYRRNAMHAAVVP